MGFPVGFHATDGGDGWTHWNVHSTADRADDGGRCDGTLQLWADTDGNYFLDSLVNNSGPITGSDCQDPRFNF